MTETPELPEIEWMNVAHILTGLVAAGSAGFYLGGRYVGDLALPSYTIEPPAWVATAQETMWLALGLAALCSILWMVVDYRQHND